jgi:hypothetical protein
VKRGDELAARLETLFASPAGAKRRFQLVEGPSDILVEETQKEGYAHILCRFGQGFRVVQWWLQTGDLRPIGSEKNADGAMLVVRPDGVLEAHVMECKQTITPSKWREALEQLEWTVIRLLAIAGALHERVGRVVLYTAYRNDKLSLDESADAELFKLPLGEEENSSARRDLSWMRSEVELPGWASRFEHVKVLKDERGHAAVDLLVDPGARGGAPGNGHAGRGVGGAEPT